MIRRRRRGAALLTVLLLVALMSLLCVALIDSVRFAQRRTLNGRSVDQARWYAIGAETLAKNRVQDLIRRQPERTTLVGDWEGRSFQFPIDGGLIQGTVHEGAACFNLNSLVTAYGVFERRDLGVEQFLYLMRSLKIPEGEAQTIANSLVDWMDSDDEPSAAGAEDNFYLDQPIPYRTAARPLAEVSELRAVRGVSPRSYALLRPWVCALPDEPLSPVNVNTLRPEKAFLLQALLLGSVSERELRNLILRRPANGWGSTLEFWSERTFTGANIPAAVRDQITVRSEYFDFDAQVLLGGIDVTLSSLIYAAPGAAPRTAARRWTREE